MSRTQRTASLFTALQAPLPQSLPPRLPPAPPTSTAQRQRERTAELWAAVQWPPSQFATNPAAQLAQQALLAQRFTPRVSLEPPDALLLELRGSVRLFGGLQPLLAQLQSVFAASAVVALAPTPLAALGFARAGKSCCLTDTTRLVSRLAPLPLRCLRWPEASLQRLAAVGVSTIGEALRLPRAGFAQRFGAHLLQDLDRLLGRRAHPRITFIATERFSSRCEPSFELADTALVLRTITPQLQQLEQFLLQRQRGITALLLRLVHRRQPPTQCVLRLAVPEHRAVRLAALLQSKLQQVVLAEPVRRCELRSGPLLVCAADSTQLWQPGEHGGGALTQMPAFLENLRARLGAAAVQGLRIAPGHRPELLSCATEPVWQSASARRVVTAVRDAPVPWPAGRRPLWLLPDPRQLPLTVDDSGHPLWQQLRLQLLAGPERLETGWWDGADICRDYYVAADGQGARLWIFRERDAGRRWFLHGYFG